MSAGLEETSLEDTPRFRNFDWDKAKTFYYVAKFGSFAGAGRYLNISQSALSRQIIYLEQHLGCPLFLRHNSGVRLTRKGQELFSIVEKSYIGFKGFTQKTYARMANGEKRKVRICATHADAAYILNAFILDYNKKHPELLFEMVENDQLIDLVLNDVDIAIRPYDPMAEGVQQEPLFTLEKKLYASLEYIEKYGEPQKVEDLIHHHLIAFGQPEEHPYADVSWILRLGMPDGKFHEPIFTSNSIECLIGAAKKGIGIIASYDKMTILKNANLRRILPQVSYQERDGYFIYPHYLKEDRVLLEIKDYLHERLKNPNQTI